MADLQVTVKGRRFPVGVTKEGKFFARIGREDPGGSDGQRVESDTFEGIKPLIEKVFKKAKVKVAVPVSVFNPGGDFGRRGTEEASVQDAILTGIHSSSRNPIIQRNGKSEQWHAYREKLLTRLSLDEAEALITARSAMVKAQATIDRIVEAHKLDPKAAVEAVFKESGV